jgi:hypothetical protein
MTIRGTLVCEQLVKKKIVVQLGWPECSVPDVNHLPGCQIIIEMRIPLYVAIVNDERIARPP